MVRVVRGGLLPGSLRSNLFLFLFVRPILPSFRTLHLFGHLGLCDAYPAPQLSDDSDEESEEIVVSPYKDQFWVQTCHESWLLPAEVPVASVRYWGDGISNRMKLPA